MKNQAGSLISKVLIVFLVFFVIAARQHQNSSCRVLAESKPIRYLQPIFSKVITSKNIVYREVTDRNGKQLQLKMDIYQPEGDLLEKRPAIIWIHGGGFHSGSKEAMKLRCEAFARFGYVTVSINYRLSKDKRDPKGTTDKLLNAIDDATIDARHAVDFLRKHAQDYRIDDGLMFVGGSSAGGVTSLHLGIEDTGWDKSGIKGIINLWGAFFGEEEEIDVTDPAVLIIHGELDDVVPFDLSVWLNEVLEKQGVPVWFYPYKNTGHGVRSKGPFPFHYEEALFLYSLM